MSAHIRTGYKLTEAGMIPADWEVKKLGELCDYQNGTSLEHLFNSRNGLRVISIGNYSADGRHIHKDSYINSCYRKTIEKFVLNKGDLAMSLNDKTSTGAILGRVLLIEADNEFVFNQRTMRLRPKSNVIPSFLHHAINGDYLHGALVSLAKPGTQIYINTDDVVDLLVPTPPVAEQHAIANVLSDMDALISGLDQLIAKKRDIKQAAMQKLLTGQQRLPGFSGEWELKRLGDLANIKTGSRNNQDKIEDGQYPFFVRSATIETINSFSLDCEAILVPGEGNIGSIFHYICGRFDVHQRVYAITQFAPEVSGKFVHLYMTRHFGAHAMQNSVKATVDSLRLPTFQNFEISIPSSKKEQSAIVAILSDMDNELTTLETQRDKARQLKQGMMQELMTGRVRLA